MISSSQDFRELFQAQADEEIVVWRADEKHFGFSVLKDYPDTSAYVSAVTKNRKKDSVVLIKIGYSVDNVEDGDVLLSVTASKASRYLLDNHWDYNFSDDDSPTEESLKQSNASPAPYDIEESSRYSLNTDSGEIFDKEKKEVSSLRILVDNVYASHVRTADDIIFRSKVKGRDTIAETIQPVIKFLEKTLFFFFGKGFKESDDFSEGIFRLYPYKSLVALSPEKIEIFGTNISISKRAAISLLVFISSVFLAYHYFCYDFLGLVSLMKDADKNFFFTAALAACSILVFDLLLPIALFLLINGLVFLRIQMMYLKIRIK